uniref:ATP synthase subunit a n=1 Tax=Orthione mesoamericana TaxID=2480053 RepID=A0A8K1Y3I6_9CRUS|nr:ATP synthase F0 subunit 6 [Orthione mesoamericana]
MALSLLTLFDPSSSWLNLPLNWGIILLVIAFTTSLFWEMTPKSELLVRQLMEYLKKEMGALVNPQMHMILPFSMVLFFFIALNNLMGLGMYTFTGTSHLSMTLSMALPLYLGYTVHGFITDTEGALSQLVPQGTPLGLVVFMVFVETTTLLIRPLTLAVRLSGNMIAGHVLIGFLEGSLSLDTSTGALVSFGGMGVLTLFEMMVAVIQAYVFSVLMILYLSHE